jgi:drug/metabolite transporter (DMT)-like permease
MIRPRRIQPPRILVDTGASTISGIALICLCYIATTIGDAGAKWALPIVGLTGAMLGRGVFGGAMVLAVAMRADASGPRWHRLLPVRWKLVIFRSLLHCGVSFIWYVAWQTMTLADTYAIAFTTPLLMTLLAIPMLGERIRWRRAVSTLVGFGGVLVMVRPGTDMFTPVTLLLLLAILGMAISRNLTRVLATTETPECISFALMAMHFPAGLLVWLFFPIPAVTWPAIAALALLGIANGIGHILAARAYGLAPVSALAPYEYTPLLWGGILGYFVFNEMPHTSALAGAAIVAGAGLYNLHREQLRQREERAAAWPS